MECCQETFLWSLIKVRRPSNFFPSVLRDLSHRPTARMKISFGVGEEFGSIASTKLTAPACVYFVDVWQNSYLACPVA